MLLSQVRGVPADARELRLGREERLGAAVLVATPPAAPPAAQRPGEQVAHRRAERVVQNEVEHEVEAVVERLQQVRQLREGKEEV